MVNNKSLRLFGLSALVLLTLLSFASATITFSNQVPVTLSQTSGSFTINVTSDVSGGETALFTVAQITDFNGKKIIFTVPSSPTSLSTIANVVPISYIVETGFDFFGKEHSTTLTADGSSSPNATQTLSFAQTFFCKWDGNNATESDLTVTIRNVAVTKGYGQDNEWFPLDEVEVEVRVKNSNNNDDIDNIAVEWGLFDKKSGDWVIEVNDENDFNLNKGDDKTLILSFKLENLDVNFEDLQNGDFVFYARATGDVDADLGEYPACASDSEPITIVDENDFVILDNIRVLPEESSCGGNIQITADVWNIGNDNQDDVYVLISNTELGITQKVVIGDINAFDNEKLDVVVKIPQDAEEKSYYLTLGVYNQDDGLYQNDYDDTDSTVDVLIKLASGSCSAEVPVAVSANLESAAKAGEEFTVRATITNTASITKTFTFEVGGYTDWATFVSVDKPSLTLTAGSSQDVLIKLKANEGVSGDKNFNIVMKEGSKVLTQPVSVSVAGNGFSITGLFAGLGGNTYLWAIGALNVLLV